MRRASPAVLVTIVLAATLLTAAPPLAAQPCTGSASYNISFIATWSPTTHPENFPSNAHFSWLVGGTHNNGVSFWSEGAIASPGIKNMAETGSTEPLLGEVRTARDAGLAGATFSGQLLSSSPGRTRPEPFTVTGDFPLVTIVSMVAPSPDWFVGVHGEPMCVNGEWRDGSFDIELLPYDAGTDAGTSYESMNSVESPAKPISRITSGPLGNGTALGTFRFVQTAEVVPALVSLSPAEATVAEGRSFTFTVSLSAAANAAVNLTWTAADGTATVNDDLEATTGRVRFRANDTADKTFTIAVTADDLAEGNETFTVDLTPTSTLPVGVMIDDDNARSTATITEAASPPPPPRPSPPPPPPPPPTEDAPPTVIAIKSFRGDGALLECESLDDRVFSMDVRFSKDMLVSTVVDDTNWRLIAAGPDNDIETEMCNGLAGDDIAVGLSALTYRAAGRRAILTVDGGAEMGSLADAPYRLIACDTLTDRDGRALDGDADGRAGDDFVRTFRVDVDNAFMNGHFDCSIDEWTGVGTRSTVDHSASMDVDNATISGSAAFRVGRDDELSIEQCVDVHAGSWRFDGSVLVGTPGRDVDVIWTCEIYTAAGCSGDSLSVQGSSSGVDSSRRWEEFGGTLNVPGGANSALCDAIVSERQGRRFNLFLDSLTLEPDAPIFMDDFETGDLSKWTEVEF